MGFWNGLPRERVVAFRRLKSQEKQIRLCFYVNVNVALICMEAFFWVKKQRVPIADIPGILSSDY